MLLGDGSVVIRWRMMTCDEVVGSRVSHMSVSVAVVMEDTEASIVGCFWMKVT